MSDSRFDEWNVSNEKLCGTTQSWRGSLLIRIAVVVAEVVIDKFDAAVAVVVEASEAARRPTD